MCVLTPTLGTIAPGGWLQFEEPYTLLLIMAAVVSGDGLLAFIFNINIYYPISDLF